MMKALLLLGDSNVSLVWRLMVWKWECSWSLKGRIETVQAYLYGGEYHELEVRLPGGARLSPSDSGMLKQVIRVTRAVVPMPESGRWMKRPPIVSVHTRRCLHRMTGDGALGAAVAHHESGSIRRYQGLTNGAAFSLEGVAAVKSIFFQLLHRCGRTTYRAADSRDASAMRSHS